jgi:hypothetical protein
MPTTEDAGPVQVPGRAASELVWRLANAGVAARCLHVVAELAVADRIDEAPVPVAALAASCAVDVDALDRVLRLLTVHGVFERHPGGYGHTPASRLLRAGSVPGMRSYARTAAELEVLLARAGFTLERVLDTPGPVRIAEARPV